ncbi:MAG TPA: heavy metal translocating P-type ATPase metal-binding domain-containing protein, partial [Vicinamibacterales bacterium]
MLAYVAQPDASSTTLRCRHCGDPCDRPVRDGDNVFCCIGCRSVYTLLMQEGLDGYYACEVPPGVPQRDAELREPDRFAALDDPATAAAFLEFDDGRIARARIPVPALHCASCVWLLERLWKLQPGVISSEVDLLRGLVRVTFDPRETTLRAIAERMAALGYEPNLALEQPSGTVPAARRRLYRQIGVAGFAFGNIMLFSIPRYVNGGPLEDGFQRLFDALNIGFALPVLLFSASDWFRAAWRTLRTGHVTLEFPVALGLAVIFTRSVADIALGTGEGFMDSFSGLVFFLLIGRLFQQKTFERMSFDRTYRSFFPLSVRVERDGACDVVPIERIGRGDVMVVRPHELVPADAVLLDGPGAVDYAFVTGESVPVAVEPGDVVHAGGRVAGHTLRLRALGPVSNSRLASLWANPILQTPKTTALASVSDRFGFWFTVCAVGIAIAGAIWWWPDLGMSARVATAVLIIACPCALTMAAPVTLGTALGQLGQRGLFARHPGVVLDMSRIDAIAFDKTGTLTTLSAPAVVEHGGLPAEDWPLVRAAAAHSVHPISRALAQSGEADGEVSELVESPGRGLSALVDGRRVRIGTAAFVGVAADNRPGVTHVSVDGRAGWVRVVVPTREGIDETVRALAREHDVHLVSGDHDAEAARWQP